MKRLTILLSLSVVGCSKCHSPTEAAAPAPAPAKEPTEARVQLGTLTTVIPARIKPTAFSSEPLKFAPVKAVADPVPLKPKSDPAWKHFNQLFAAKATADALAANGVAVDANTAFDEFFQLYEQNRYRPLLISSVEQNGPDDFVIKRHFLSAVPSVVTPDVVLHNLHLFFDYALATAEEQTLAKEAASLVGLLAEETKRQRSSLQGTPWADAASDNLVFIEVARYFFGAVSLRLPEPASDDFGSVGADTAEQIDAFAALLGRSVDERLDPSLPDGVKAKVRTEVARILAAKERVPLTIFESTLKEDYTQYKPRGHYVKTTGLQAYFRGMMWLSRAMMSVSADRPVQSAVLLTLAVSPKDTLTRWQKLSDTIGFLVGPPDDLSVVELFPALAKAAELGPLTEPASFAALKVELAKLRPPKIQSARTERVSGPSLDSQKALHFFPQRAVIDAELLQGLVDPQVPTKNQIDALEIPAVLGSTLARSLVTAAKLDAFDGYAAQQKKLEAELPRTLAQRSTEDFAAGWLAALGPLITAAPPESPRFMLGDAFARLSLSTYLASYAELKHDTVLYAKQALAEMGGPGFEDTEESIDKRGYVVPEVELYARVTSLLSRLRTGLGTRGLFPQSLTKSWTAFEELSGRLEAISRKELAGEPLGPEDYHLIEFIGGDLEHFWEDTLIVRPSSDRWMLLRDNNTRIVADIFTGPAGVHHVASGYVHPVYVAFPRDGKIAIGRGAVLSFYQLTVGDRLTDQQWRERLSSEHRPPLPDWTRPVFISEPEKPLHFPQPDE